ncbi:universal stress protein [Bacillus sp. H-16]|uniref:universal stress protein n=1 Tax=Alteribacter salitolerans TaxID=2912333 RepID=UPI0019626D44|nr:universal stress protein [Alteribacter salitolerans]MBM7094378.1 universal stress protein [Alteribacter salitolerans]
MYKKILLAADGSEHAVRATENAVYIAQKKNGTRIDLVHVVDETPVRSDVLSQAYPIRTIPEERVEKLAPIIDKLNESGVQFQTKAFFGDPGPSIVKAANEGDYDLVIIGSRGLNQFQQMVLGSVSHKVAKRVKCPVMIVK